MSPQLTFPRSLARLTAAAAFIFLAGTLTNSSSLEVDQGPADAELRSLLKDFYEQPAGEWVQQLVDFLREKQSKLSPRTFDFGVTFLLQFGFTLNDEPLNESVDRLTGIDHRRIAQIGMGLREEEGEVGVSARKLLESIPNATIELYCTSWCRRELDTKALGSRGVKILTENLETESESNPMRKERTFSVLASVIRENQATLDREIADRAITALVAGVIGKSELENLNYASLPSRLYTLRGIDDPRIIKLAKSYLNSKNPEVKNAAQALLDSITKKTDSNQPPGKPPSAR
jgi:hypothetical protein